VRLRPELLVIEVAGDSLRLDRERHGETLTALSVPGIRVDLRALFD
jgi:hypothetical protein